MHIKSRIQIAALLTCVAAATSLSRGQTPAPITYGVEDIGPPGAASSYASSIDFYGRVVGAGLAGNERAFYFNGWQTAYLETLDARFAGTRSAAVAQHNGQIAGWFIPAGSTTSRGFIYDRSGVREIGTLGGPHTIPEDMDQNGRVVGSSSLPSGTKRAFLYDNTGMHDLGTLGGSTSVAYATNGEAITGSSTLADGSTEHAFLIQDGTMRDLGTLGGVRSVGRALNWAAHVVGGTETSSGELHPFLFDGTAMRDLGTLGGRSGEAFGINGHGHIVGQAATANQSIHAFLYRNGQMIDLNDLIDPASGWVLIQARAINDYEQIAGYGTYQGTTRAFLLTPPQDIDVSPFGNHHDTHSNFPRPMHAGRDVIFMIALRNVTEHWGQAATRVKVVDELSGPAEYVDTDAGPGNCNINARVLTCFLIVGDGSGADLRVRVRTTGPGEFSHTAHVSAVPFDPNPANNVLTETNTAVSLASASVTPETVIGGRTTSLQVWLTSPAPTSGSSAALTSSNPAVVPVPGFLEVLDGGVTRVASLRTTPVTVPTSVQLTARYGLVTRSATVTVVPPALSSFAMPTTIVSGCGAAVGLLTLNGIAPTGGQAVTFSEALSAVAFPASVTVPAGSKSASFSVVPESVTASEIGPVAATSGGVTSTRTLHVRPIRANGMVLTPSATTGGSVVTGTITLECAPSSAVTVSLGSSDATKAAPIAASLVIPGGSKTGTFSVRTSNVAAVSNVSLYATVNGRRTTGTLTLNPAGSLPGAWQSADVGAVGVTGSASESGGIFTVKGAGADIWGRADAFRYVYQPLTGDGTITARVATIQGTHPWTKTGVMIRATTGANAAHGLMLVSTGRGTAFQRRTVEGGISTSTAGPAGTAPRWVRLTRAGNLLTASTSVDGVSWTVVGNDTVALPPTALIGFVSHSHDLTAIATATFGNVAIVR